MFACGVLAGDSSWRFALVPLPRWSFYLCTLPKWRFTSLPLPKQVVHTFLPLSRFWVFCFYVCCVCNGIETKLGVFPVVRRVCFTFFYFCFPCLTKMDYRETNSGSTPAGAPRCVCCGLCPLCYSELTKMCHSETNSGFRSRRALICFTRATNKTTGATTCPSRSQRS